MEAARCPDANAPCVHGRAVVGCDRTRLGGVQDVLAQESEGRVLGGPPVLATMTASFSNSARISARGRKAVRVARMAASTTACRARLKPRKSRNRPLGDRLDQDPRPLVPVVQLDDPELVVAASSRQDPAGDDLGRPELGLRGDRDADRRLGEQEDVVGDVEDAFAPLLQIAVGGRGAIRPELEPLRAQVGTEPGTHGGDVELALGAQRCDDAFQDHGRVSSPRSASASPGSGFEPCCVACACPLRRARWLSSGSVRKPHSSA